MLSAKERIGKSKGASRAVGSEPFLFTDFVLICVKGVSTLVQAEISRRVETGAGPTRKKKELMMTKKGGYTLIKSSLYISNLPTRDEFVQG